MLQIKDFKKNVAKKYYLKHLGIIFWNVIFQITKFLVKAYLAIKIQMRPQNILAFVLKNKSVQWLGQFRIPNIKVNVPHYFQMPCQRKMQILFHTESYICIYSMFLDKKSSILFFIYRPHKFYLEGSVTCPENRIIPVKLSLIKNMKGRSHVNSGCIMALLNHRNICSE